MKSALIRDIFSEIKSTAGRFMAIFAIVALGVGFFAGLKATSPDMKLTADSYFDAYGLADIRLLSAMGFTDEDIAAIRARPGIEAVLPSYSADALVEVGGTGHAARLMMLPGADASINPPILTSGRMPQNSGECLIDGLAASAVNGGVSGGRTGLIGQKLIISSGNSDFVNDLLPVKEYTIVGTAATPSYISFQRGATNIGAGKLAFFVMLPEDAFSSDYYTEAYLAIDGAKELSCYSDEYTGLIDGEMDALEVFAGERENIRYEDIVAEGSGKIADAQAELDNAEEKYASSEAELNDAKRELDDARAQFDESVAEADDKLAEAKDEIEQGEDDIESAKGELSQNEGRLAAGEEEYARNRADYDNRITAGQQELDAGYAQLGQKKMEYDAAAAAVADGWIQHGALVAQAGQLMAEGREEEAAALYAQAEAMAGELNAQQSQLDAAAGEISQSEAALAEAQTALDAATAEGWAAIASARNELDSGHVQLEAGRDRISSAEGELETGKEEYTQKEAEADQEISDARKEIDDAQAKIDDAQAELDSAREELDGESKKLEDAKKDLSELEPPEWYVLDRNANPGYAGFASDADKISAVASVFPVFFFIVAALVCLTTMTRMVEEQRTGIGVLKALGYGRGAVASKYLIYALLASISGSAAGLLIGFWIFPTVIWRAYGILYSMPPIIARFDTFYAVTAAAAACASTLLAALFSCINELKAVPAELIRPKAPPPGKRVFLEKIPAIWRRLKFNQKVTARNLFRYKKRFIMTIVGIGGCAALMLTGFGLRDSISNIVSRQFGDVHTYDAIVTLKDPGSSTDSGEVNAAADAAASAYVYAGQPPVTASSGNASMEAYIFVPEQPEALGGFVDFKDRITGKSVDFPNTDGVVVTEKLANTLGLSPGDPFTLRRGDSGEARFTVGGITENYIYNYVYMTPEEYESAFTEPPEYREIFFTAKNENLTEEDEADISTELLTHDGIESVSFVTKISRDFGDIMKSLDGVVVVLILCANLLAFIVLLNLANINITERTREIATIKVLGFYDREVSSYVFRENIILTAIGALFGLAGGIFLHSFVVSTAEVDIVMFERSINWLSYAMSAALTFAFAFAVNFIEGFRLRKIDMVESLKSGE